MMINFLFGVLRQTWEIMEEASVFLLFGFLLAGMLGILVPGRLLTRLVGTGKIKSVLWGSVVGAPIPMCSCGVLPTALGLRKQGATPGATVAFLVATPETGVDSISLTYALTDPVMTLFRPIAGVATAIAAGLATNLFGAPRSKATEPPLEAAKTPAAGTSDVSTQTTPEDIITRTGTITTTTMTRGRIRCRTVAPAGQSLIRQGTSSVTASSSCSTT